MSTEIRVLLADDHPVLRAGLKHVIDADPVLRVVAEVGDGASALEQMHAQKPDVAVLDLDMPKVDGFAVLREMARRRLTPAVIILTFHNDEELLNEAMALGAKGYLLKDSALTSITEGIRAVADGQHYVSPSLTWFLLRRRSRGQALEARQPGLADLTEIERRILKRIASGDSSKEIAEQLFIHYRTVENHRGVIARKLGLEGHNAVLKFALRHRTEL